MDTAENDPSKVCDLYNGFTPSTYAIWIPQSEVFVIGNVFGAEYNAHVRANQGRNDGELKRWLANDANLEALLDRDKRYRERMEVKSGRVLHII